MESYLSIIIPARNEEKYLERCLDALSMATDAWGGEYEVIVVDNGSNDSTRDIAAGKGCIVLEETVATIARLRNIGVKGAKGELIAFLDADCLVNPNWINYCLENFEDLRIGIVGTRAIPDLNDATWVERAWFRLISGSVRRTGYLDWIGTSNFFVKRHDFINIGGFDEYFQTAEDVNFGYKMRKADKLIFLETRVDTTHLRESKTLTELFKREFWRGKSSLASYVKNGFILRELPGIAVPFVNGIGLIALLALLIYNPFLAFIPLLIVVALPVILMKRKGISFGLEVGILQCYVVATIYILARTCSLPYEISFRMRKPLSLISQKLAIFVPKR